ncbi:tyrosine-protein kinase receptor torso isoform X1 [Orussus abietinus]|uniref:tyrosine-protein kinase receptor torso isoform X1 n=2 Tax=Orussus abietinus TaxID=222816 RepID=UPI00062558F5|nr:tyrosine-protein kinase receptor torso isoform X1 [Orussus abietinus]
MKESEIKSKSCPKTFELLLEETDSNVSLHCKETDFMTIRHNPGIYIIEKRTRETSWSDAIVGNGTFSTLLNLTSGTEFQYRMHRVTENGILKPEVTQWFGTKSFTNESTRIRNIFLEKIEVDENDANSLQAQIAFEPDEELSCDYEVMVLMDTSLKIIQLRKTTDFRVKLLGLEYDRKAEVRISPTSSGDLKNGYLLMFSTPSCLDVHHDLNICAPGEVEGLRAEYRHKHGSSFDIKVSWKEPILQPDNYTIELLPMHHLTLPDLLVLSGNATSAVFANVNISTQQYRISIVAKSPGGISPKTSIDKTIDSNPALNNVHIALLTAMTISSLFGIVFVCWRFGKGTSFVSRFKHFHVSIKCIFNFGHLETHLLQILTQNGAACDSMKGKLKSDNDAHAKEGVKSKDKFEIHPDQLKIKDILGRGASGIVRLGSFRNEHGRIMDVAVKALKDNPSSDDLKNFQQEILTMKSAGQHPNIVSLIGCCTQSTSPFLVVEYCCRGDLQTYLRAVWKDIDDGDRQAQGTAKGLSRFPDQYLSYVFESFNDFTDDAGTDLRHIREISNRLYDIEHDVLSSIESVTASDLLNFARQVATGMEFLSSNRIVHRDLAARNVLLCGDMTVKISDFGLSRDVYQENVYKKQGNGMLPLKWMAIESLTHHVYTTHSDVWSFGILLWEIVTLGCNPYPGTSTSRVLRLLKSGYRMERPQNCGVELYNMMLACWRSRPKDRPTFTELKQSLEKMLHTSVENSYLNVNDLMTGHTTQTSPLPEEDSSSAEGSERSRFLSHLYANEQ